MDSTTLQKFLSPIALGGLRHFDSIGSTNNEALAWALNGAADFSLVSADEQTAGRGRSRRKWVTPRGAALAFSLILRPSASESASPSLITGLGAVALVDALRSLGLTAQIKWPNDVLINRKKVAGILAETSWSGDKLEAIVLGIGVNVLSASVPPPAELSFPATSVEAELGQTSERFDLLRNTLQLIAHWRERLATGELLEAWNQSLAYKGQQVRVWQGAETALIGVVDGLEADGSLRLQVDDKFVTVHFGEIHLRPA